MGPPFAGGRSSIAARLTGGPGPGGGLKKPWSMALPYYHGGCREFIIGTIERGWTKTCMADWITPTFSDRSLKMAPATPQNPRLSASCIGDGKVSKG